MHTVGDVRIAEQKVHVTWMLIIKPSKIAAELDVAPVDENGSTVGSRTWHTQNGTHWKPKEKVVHTTDDLLPMQ